MSTVERKRNRSIIVQTVARSSVAAEIAVPDELRILDDGEQPPAGAGIFRVMTPQDGDKRVVWERTLAEIREAKKLFVKLVKEGLTPYRVDAESGRATAEVMREFDPAAGEVIFMPVALVKGG